MINNTFDIHLYTNKFCIYNHEKKRVFVEKNMIAVENKKNVIAYGDSAYEMFEKAPDNIVVSAPLNNGVISDIVITVTRRTQKTRFRNMVNL